MPFTRLSALAVLTVCTALASTASAQSVALSGVLGSKALLLIDSHPPKALGPNEAAHGVRLIHLRGDVATVEVQGQRHEVRLGASPANVGRGLGADGRTLVLRADARGHFGGQGFINNTAVQYMVDTGATTIGISQDDAQRIGLNVQQRGTPVMIRTANGTVQGWHIRLDTVRIGGITQYGIDAVVSPQPMPFVLLGNSFLSQLHMTRRGNEMVLEQR